MFGSGYGTGKAPIVVHRQWTHRVPPVALAVWYAVGVGTAALGTFGCRVAATAARRSRSTIWVFVSAVHPKPRSPIGEHTPSVENRQFPQRTADSGLARESDLSETHQQDNRQWSLLKVDVRCCLRWLTSVLLARIQKYPSLLKVDVRCCLLRLTSVLLTRIQKYPSLSAPVSSCESIIHSPL